MSYRDCDLPTIRYRQSEHVANSSGSHRADSRARRGDLPLILAAMVIVISLLWIAMPSSAASLYHRPTSADSCASLMPTQYYMVVFGDITWNGVAAAAGSEVVVRSPRGDVVGCRITSEDGRYRATKIYGEQTIAGIQLPGLRSGEVLAFELDGLSVESSPTIFWDAGSASTRIDLTGPRPSSVPDVQIGLNLSTVSLSWSPVSTNQTGAPVVIDHYEIYGNPDPFFNAYDAAFLGQSQTSSFQHTLADPNQNYYFVIRAIDGDGITGLASQQVGRFVFPLTIQP